MGPVIGSLADDYTSFVRMERDGASSMDIAVHGARCANCLAKIEHGARAISGVVGARLNLSTGKLHVTWRDNADAPAAIVQRLRALGYEAAPFDAGQSLDADDRYGADLLRCLAVAGFGAVFVVGLTDAIWYGGEELSDAGRNLMFGLAAVISIPVTLFAARPFVASALKALRARQTNMDVPIVLAIVLALALSVYQTLIHARHTYFDAAVMLAFLLLIGRYLDFRLRAVARSAARHLLTLQTALARRLRPDEALETVAAAELEPGDRVLLAAGERVPADGRLDRATEADISLVTGESVPAGFAPGEVIRAGSIILDHPVVLCVEARTADSLVADLARLLEAGQQTRSLYVRLADRAARAYVPFVTAASLFVFGGWLWFAPLSTALTNAIAVLIITCPCALGLAVPAVQIVATGRLFNRGIFVKSGDALERLAEVDTAIFDKTGTLTSGDLVLANREAVQPETLEAAARLARASRHPLARAVAAAAGEGQVADEVRELPGLGLEAMVDGERWRLGSAAWCGVEGDAPRGALWFGNGTQHPVCFLFEDHLHPEAGTVISDLAARRIAIEMLTGDRAPVAAQVAAEAGVARWHASAGPMEKAAHIRALRDKGHHVLMVGDGINDAGALAQAHVSIAPGTAADVSQRAADLVLRGRSLAPIVEAIDVARKARRLVLQNLVFAAVYNVAAIPLAAMGLVTPLIAAAAMAGSSLIVTLNALRLAGGRQ
jgi:Cu2+-exporting ATPase